MRNEITEEQITELMRAIPRAEEVDRLRADNERLQNEDTKTRHALKGWVYVCPDGGDEPTHERVAAVVAEVERLRAEMQSAKADAWDEGEESAFVWGSAKANPYRGKRKK